MSLINILITLLIIYLVFLIIDKFTGYVFAILLAVLFAVSIPYIWKGIVWLFKSFGELIMKPFYWITGYEIVLPYWIGLIIFALIIIPLISLWKLPMREEIF